MFNNLKVYCRCFVDVFHSYHLQAYNIKFMIYFSVLENKTVTTLQF